MKTINIIIYTILVSASIYFWVLVTTASLPGYMLFIGSVATTLVITITVQEITSGSKLPVRWLQMGCIWLKLITIVSSYELNRSRVIHRESRIYFFWIPRWAILSDKTKILLDFMESGIDGNVFEERYVGENEK